MKGSNALHGLACSRVDVLEHFLQILCTHRTQKSVPKTTGFTAPHLP
jgi:hypothetical protein